MGKIMLKMGATIPLVEGGDMSIEIALEGDDLATLHDQARFYIARSVIVKLTEWKQVSDVDPTRSRPFAWLSVFSPLDALTLKETLAKTRKVDFTRNVQSAEDYVPDDPGADFDHWNGG